MQWENLTAFDFNKAVESSKGVCLLAAGCVEKHGEHLPLGVDYLSIHKACVNAAENEPAVVFPPYYFGQIFEAKHCPGTVALKPALLYDVLENICDEIGRNGFKKIIIVNGHGGNFYFLPYFVQTMLDKKKNYLVYAATKIYGSLQDKIEKIIEVPEMHAGEYETSLMMDLDKNLVKMENLPKDKNSGKPLKRTRNLDEAGLYTPVCWYADFPNHYAGDASKSTAEKGKKISRLVVDYISGLIRTVKDDKIAPKLYNEFFGKCEYGKKKD